MNYSFVLAAASVAFFFLLLGAIRIGTAWLRIDLLSAAAQNAVPPFAAAERRSMNLF
ncbi:MAG: hypothetical protein ACN6PR_01525 [Achromobacter sp.]